MTTPRPDHRCRIEHKNVETPARSRQVARTVCNCGWVSDWLILADPRRGGGSASQRGSGADPVSGGARRTRRGWRTAFYRRFDAAGRASSPLPDHDRTRRPGDSIPKSVAGSTSPPGASTSGRARTGPPRDASSNAWRP